MLKPSAGTPIRTISGIKGQGAAPVTTSRPSRPLRIVLFSPAWPHGGWPNGIVTYSRTMVPALRAAGAEVIVLSASIDPGGEGPDVRALEPKREGVVGRILARFEPEGAASRRVADSIAAALKELDSAHRVDAFEMEESFGWCGLVAERTRVPVIARLHGPWFLNGAMVADATAPAFQRRVRREGAALLRVAGITAPSRDVLARTRAHYGVALAHAAVIPNPIESVAAETQWVGHACDPDSILFVGRFDRHKGGDVVIEAMSHVRAQLPNARLIFAGPDVGLTDDAGRHWTLREYIEAKLEQPSDRAAVCVLGSQTREQILELRMRAAVTVVSSRWENFAYSLSEALVMGCPTVASNAGGLAEVIDHEKTGLLVQPGDPEDLARGIIRLLRDRALAERLGKAAADAVAARLAPPQIAAETLAYYDQIAAQRR